MNPHQNIADDASTSTTELKFHADIPANPGLVSDHPFDPVASSIQAGDIIQNQDREAMVELTNRELLYSNYTKIVTDKELRDSQRRKVLVDYAIAAGSNNPVAVGGIDGIIARMTEMQRQLQAQMTEMQSQLQAQMTGMKTDMTGMKTDMTKVKTDVTEIKNDMTGMKNDMTGMKTNLETKLDTLTAKSENFEIRRRIRREPGFWSGIQVDRTGANSVGTVPNRFPSSESEAMQLTHAQVNALEAAYNLPAQSFAGNSITDRRLSLLIFLKEGKIANMP